MGPAGARGLTRARISDVPRWSRTRVRGASVAGPDSASSISTSSAVEAVHGWATSTATSPRSTSPRSTPTSPSAVRVPGTVVVRSCPYDSTDRTRATRSRGSSRTDSPTFTEPDHAVPVMTVPTPATLNERSTGRRKRSGEARLASAAIAVRSRSRSSGMPRPVTAETIAGAPKATGERWNRPARSATTSSAHSGSTRSALVNTGIP